MRTPWMASDLEVLRTLYPDHPTAAIAARLGRPVSRVYAKASHLGLHKSAAYLASPAAHRLDGVVGTASRFQKGQAPANKGLRRPGWHRGRMRETQFQKGVRQGVAVHLYQPIGTERLSKEGYLQRKVNDDFPLQARWKAVHTLVWEAANGPVPKSYALVFKNGDKRDIRLDNLELLSRADLMRRNTYHRYPKEIALAIQMRGALVRSINKRSRRAKQD